MKTAKEMCEELLEKNIDYILNDVLRDGGETSLDYKLSNDLKSKLIELGYKVTEKTVLRNNRLSPKTKEITTTKTFLGIFSYKTKGKIPDGYEQIETDQTIISACCGEK
jgi:hypothetical protein